MLDLLNKDPSKRATADDILQAAWIQCAKNKVSNKQRQSFRTTVVRRKIRKTSMGVFEKTSKNMRKFYRSRDDSYVLFKLFAFVFCKLICVVCVFVLKLVVCKLTLSYQTELKKKNKKQNKKIKTIKAIIVSVTFIFGISP